MDDGKLIQIIPKTIFQSNFLVGAVTFENIIQPAINVIPYSQVIVMLRFHSKSADLGSAIEVILRDTDPSTEDAQDFTITSATFITVSATSTVTIPTLLKSAVATNPGPYLRVIVKQYGPNTGSTKGTFEISADMLVRSGV